MYGTVGNSRSSLRLYFHHHLNERTVAQTSVPTVHYLVLFWIFDIRIQSGEDTDCIGEPDCCRVNYWTVSGTPGTPSEPVATGAVKCAVSPSETLFPAGDIEWRMENSPV